MKTTKYNFRNGRYNNYRDANYNQESDIIFEFKIGYYENGSFHKLYANETYHCRDNGLEFTVDSKYYDENGNESFLDLGAQEKNVLPYFGLTRLIESADTSAEYYQRPEYKGKDFDKYTCTPSDWAKPLIEEAIAYDIVPENLQHLYKSKITRGEFCQLICAVIEKTQGKSLSNIIAERGGFTLRDNDKGVGGMLGGYESMTDYLKNMGYTELCEKAGIITGYGNGELGENDFLTRQQAAVILKRTLEFLGFDTENAESIRFTDEGDFASWGAEGINFISACEEKIKNTRIMNGKADGSFKPNEYYTKEQAIVTMKRATDFLQVPIVRWLQGTSGEENLELKVNKYANCEVFDDLNIAKDFEYDGDYRIIKYVSDSGAAIKDLFYYGYSGESLYEDKEKPEIVEKQLASIIAELTEEDSTQNAAQIKYLNSSVAKALISLSEPKIETSDSITAKSLLKIYKSISKVDGFDWANFTLEQGEYVLNDYVESMVYIDTISEALEATDNSSTLMTNALKRLSEDYEGDWLKNAMEKIEKKGFSQIANMPSSFINSLIDKIIARFSGRVSASYAIDKTLDINYYKLYNWAVSASLKISGLEKRENAAENLAAALCYSNAFAEGYKYYAKKIVDNNYTADDVANCERMFALAKAARINEYKNFINVYTSKSQRNEIKVIEGSPLAKEYPGLTSPMLNGTNAAEECFEKEIQKIKNISYNN